MAFAQVLAKFSVRDKENKYGFQKTTEYRTVVEGFGHFRSIFITACDLQCLTVSETFATAMLFPSP